MKARKKMAVVPRKHPEQDRSRATVEAILDATAHVLVKSGYEAFTTNRVAERAGVSIGSLYQYFPNKEALLRELSRRHLEDIERAVTQALGDAEALPLAELVRIAVKQSVRTHTVDPELHRVLSEEVPQTGKDDWKREHTARVEARIKHLLELKSDELAVTNIELAVFVVTRTAEAVVHNAVSERSEDFHSGALAEELSQMIISYLTGRKSPSPIARRATG